MSYDRRSFEPQGLTVAYNKLGTITVEELKHALIEDLNTLQDVYNVQFVRISRIKFYPTDEYGREIRVRRPGGGRVHLLDTHHLKPMCKDYDL